MVHVTSSLDGLDLVDWLHESNNRYTGGVKFKPVNLEVSCT